VDARRSNSESCETELMIMLPLRGRIWGWLNVRGGLVYYVSMVRATQLGVGELREATNHL
jgi:hypothetical protein